jgi:hypothetical protein
MFGALVRPAGRLVCFDPMRFAFPTVALVPLWLLASACAKDDPKGTAPMAPADTTPLPTASAAAVPPPASDSAAPAVSESPVAGVPAPTCPAGLTGNPVPAFCIKLPSSYHVKDARITPAKGSIAYDTGVVTDNLMISYDATPLAEQAKDVASEMKFGGDKLEKKGDLSGGNKWFRGSHDDFERVITLFKGPPPLTLKCSFTYKPKSPPPKEAVETCKSIVVP